MELPYRFVKKPLAQKAEILGNIREHLVNLDTIKYPNIVTQMQYEESKVELIDYIILNLYSEESATDNIERILSSFESTL